MRTQKSASRVRYQVLWDNRDREHPNETYGQIDFGPREKRLAEAAAAKYRAMGMKNVSVWDTLNNPISDMFRF